MSQNRKAAEKVAIFISYSAITFGVSTAYLSPATGYELSLYRATPVIFWVGIGIAMFVAIVGSLYFAGAYRRIASIIAGVLSILLISLLPYIRSYWYLGRHDALSHLGTTNTIMQSGEVPRVLIYPAIHILGLVFKVATDFTTAQSLGILPAIFVMLFVVLIPINSKLLNGESKPYIPILAGVLLLPIITINNPVLQPIPSTMAVLFLPLPVYLILRHLSRQSQRFGIPLVLSLITLVFLHPQYAAALLILLTTILIAQFTSYSLELSSLSDVTKLALIPTGILGVVLIRWVASKPTSQSAVHTLFTQLYTGVQVGQQVSEQGRTLQRVGGGLIEIFLKVFFIEFLFVLLAVGVVFLYLFSWFMNKWSQQHSVVAVIGIGLVPASSLFLAYVSISLPNQYFRYLSFLFVFATIFGAIGLQSVLKIPKTRFSKLALRQIVAILFIGSVLLSVPAFYQSPYIYRPTGGVSEQHVHGFKSTFEYTPTPLATLASPTDRYEEAIYGRDGSPNVEPKTFQYRGHKPTRVPFHFANQSLHSVLQNKTYLAVTSADRRLYVDLFDGIHYSSDDFKYLDTNPRIAKVQSNNEYDLYLIYPQHVEGNRTLGKAGSPEA